MNKSLRLFIQHFILFTGIMTTVSCGEAASNAVISGKLNGAEAGTKMYLDLLGAANIVTLDSLVLTEDGKFEFNPTLTEKSFYRLRCANDKGALLLLDSTERIQLEMDTDMVNIGYIVKGSKDSERMSVLSKVMHKSYYLKDSLNQLYRQNYNQITEEMVNDMRTTMQNIEDEFRNDVRAFIQANAESLASLAAIEQLDIDNDFATFEMVDKSLAEKYASSPYYQSFHSKFEYQSQFAVGRAVPEITLPNPSGGVTSLSSLKGKIVLIDFWASWCRPCRMENPNVVRLYNQYKNENFEIFSVSLDREKGAWLQAIEQDNMDWVHVSDLMFWQSPVVKLYNISGIPHTLLIDEEGRIIGKNLRGAQLANKLKEIFG
jgi:thiol-disulfide isomerase/thioredoxin